MEKNYVVYNDLGEITEWGLMSEENIALNSSLSGKNYLVGLGLPYTHRVDLETKTIVPLSQPLVQLPSNPANNQT